MFASYYTLNQAMGTNHNRKLTHWLPQEMADNTQEINITSKPFGNFIYSNLSSFPWMIFKWWALNWMGPTQYLFKWNRLEMDGEKRVGYSSVRQYTKMNGEITVDKTQRQVGTDRKGKRKTSKYTQKARHTKHSNLLCISLRGLWSKIFFEKTLP